MQFAIWTVWTFQVSRVNEYWYPRLPVCVSVYVDMHVCKKEKQGEWMKTKKLNLPEGSSLFPKSWLRLISGKNWPFWRTANTGNRVSEDMPLSVALSVCRVTLQLICTRRQIDRGWPRTLISPPASEVVHARVCYSTVDSDAYIYADELQKISHTETAGTI